MLARNSIHAIQGDLETLKAARAQYGLPKARGVLTEQACEDVARTSGRERNNPVDRSCGIALRLRETERRWQSQRGSCETQEGSARYRHGSQPHQNVQCTRCNVATPDAPVDTVGFLHVSWSPLSVNTRFCSAPSSFG